MPRLKLNDRAVERLRPDPDGKQVLYWDEAQPGFGVLVSSRVASFVVKKGATRRTLGRVGVMTLAEAREAARSLLRGDEPLTDAAATLAEALDRYLKARHDLAPRTRQGYLDAVRRHFPDWADRPLREITRAMVEERHRSIPGAASANAAARVLRAVYNFAADRDSSLPANPVRLRRQWRPAPPREGHVRPDQLPAFYAAVQGLASPIGRDYLLLVLFTGMRRAEAAGLRWSDVDLVAKTLTIPAERNKAKRKLILPLADFVYDLLAARRAIGKTEFIFPANSASRHIEEPRFFLDQVAESCGVKATVHDLRRTFITTAESCDISTYALKALVNHAANRDVTAGYIQMTPERLRAPAQKVADRLRQLCGA